MKNIMAEIRLITIAIDLWAVMEHHMKYKKNTEHKKNIQGKLKYCVG